MSYQASFDFGDEALQEEPVPYAPQAGSPLAYELRVSPRARRVTLRVVQGRGLVVTIPRRFPKRDVADVVQAHREWALEALADMEARTPEVYREWPPGRLELSASNTRVFVAFETDTTARLPQTDSSLEHEHVLRLGCPAGSREQVARAVAHWLRPVARRYLGGRASVLAARHGVSFERLSIRGQRSVWGSYSSSGTLSLNYKLMFLRPELVDYVVLHELAHTRHLDHSGEFWGLLERMCPGARILDRELADAGRLVPPWLELAR